MKEFERRIRLLRIYLPGNAKTREKRNENSCGLMKEKCHSLSFILENQLLSLNLKLRRNFPSLPKERRIYLKEDTKWINFSQDNRTRKPERMYPEDFQGAAPGGGIIYISSDEDEAMECKSVSSITDFLPSSEDESEKVAMMALYVETQMPTPIPHSCRSFYCLR